MPDPFGRPPIPPAIKTPGIVIARFVGWIESYGSSPKGFDRITIAVEPKERYKMLRMTDERGIQLQFEVFKPDRSTTGLDSLDQDLSAALAALEMPHEE